MTPPPNGHPARRYFDHAATSFPKPDAVLEHMTDFATRLGVSPGRGAYREVVEADDILAACRARLCALFNGADPNHIAFTLNATDALNLAIKGVVRHHLRRGERAHVVTTWMDHNSVLRPLRDLEREGVTVTRVECDPTTGHADVTAIRDAIRPHTRLVVTLHGSNVTGTLQDIGAIGAVCRRMDVPFLVDAAQTLGHVPLDVEAMNIDVLAFPGHKGLLGPLGTGGLYLRPGIEESLETLREGGTGTVSERDVQPESLPEKYEPGSHNTIGLAGLAASVEWILTRGVDDLWRHERALTARLLDGLRDVRGVRVLGPRTIDGRCGVVSIRVQGMTPADVAETLEDRFGVLTRAGLHRAPLAHRTIGTHADGGTTRLSVGPFITEDDIDHVVESVSALCTTDAGVVHA